MLTVIFLSSALWYISLLIFTILKTYSGSDLSWLKVFFKGTKTLKLKCLQIIGFWEIEKNKISVQNELYIVQNELRLQKCKCFPWGVLMKMKFMWQSDKSIIYFLFSRICDFCIPFPCSRAVSQVQLPGWRWRKGGGLLFFVSEFILTA